MLTVKYCPGESRESGKPPSFELILHFIKHSNRELVVSYRLLHDGSEIYWLRIITTGELKSQNSFPTVVAVSDGVVTPAGVFMTGELSFLPGREIEPSRLLPALTVLHPGIIRRRLPLEISTIHNAVMIRPIRAQPFSRAVQKLGIFGGLLEAEIAEHKGVAYVKKFCYSAGKEKLEAEAELMN